MIIYRDLNSGSIDLRILISHVHICCFLRTRPRRLQRRVAEIVDVAAFRLGLQRIIKGSFSSR